MIYIFLYTRYRPQEVVPGNFAGSEMWRSIQTIENAKGRVNSFIQGRGVKILYYFGEKIFASKLIPCVRPKLQFFLQ